MKNQKANTSVIFLTVLIEMLGVGIVIPIIPTLFFHEDSTFFAPGVHKATIGIYYGLLVSSFYVMQFFGAPFLGALSDRFGRKPLLNISLIGTCIGYGLFAVSIIYQNLWLMFFSRMLPGFMGGNISIIMSAMADISTAETKARNFGLVGAAFGVGFVLGPFIAGILGDSSIVPWFNYATPFWFTAILTFINIFLVRFRFPETLKEKSHRKISFFSGVQNLVISFKTPNLRIIFIVVLLLGLGFTFFTQFFSVYLIEDFSYSLRDIGLFYAWVGVWLIFTQGVIVRRMSGKVPSSQVISFTLLILSLSIGLLLIPGQSFWFFIISPFIAVSNGITGPNLTAVVSDQGSEDRQGEILGIKQSMQSVGAAIPPLIAGWLTSLDTSYPIVVSTILILMSWLVYMIFFKGRRQVRKTEN
ncbi:MAG: MFS transporter [Bacteroidetes bacterium]|nr:MAG: MFS transporter [Bacteroidota bacterium]